MSVRGYTLGIDWDNTGDPATVGADATADVLADQDIVVEWGRDTTQAGQQPAAGNVEVWLRNDTAKYNLDNASSALYGKVLPGRRVQFFHTQPDVLDARLFDGETDGFDTEDDGRIFKLTALDAWGKPGQESLSTPVYQGIRTGDAVGYVLDAIGWTGGRSIDAGASVLPYWWAEGIDAATAIERLVDAEGPPAIAYVQSGVFVFEDRHHRILDTASTTSQATFTHIVPEGTGPAGTFKIARDSFTLDHGLSRIVNTVAFSVDVRTPAPPAEVWSTDDPIALTSGVPLSIEAQATDPFIDAQTPAVQVGSAVSVAATLSRTSGQSVTITLTAAADCVVTRIGLTATPIPVARTVKIAASDPSSVGQLGRQTWDRDVPYVNPYDAQSIATRIVALYATRRRVVTFSIANLDTGYLTQIRTRRISDLVTVRNDAHDIDTTFTVEKVRHIVKQLGLVHTLELTCEEAPPPAPSNPFRFNTAGAGFNQGQFSRAGLDRAGGVFRFNTAGQGFSQGVFAT